MNEPTALMSQETEKLNGFAPTIFNEDDFKPVSDDVLDDDEFSFEDESEGNSPENPSEISDKKDTEKQSRKKKNATSIEDEGVLQKQAAGMTTLYCIGLKYACGAISGDSPEEYVVSKADREDLTVLFSDYMAIKGEILTPEQKLLMGLGAISLHYGGKAWQSKQEKKRNKGLAKKLVQDGSLSFGKNGEVVTGTKLTEAPKVYTGRRQFKIFKSTGCYSKTEKGLDIPLAEAKEKAPDWIIKMWETARKEDWTESETNKRILDIILSGEQMAKSV